MKNYILGLVSLFMVGCSISETKDYQNDVVDPPPMESTGSRDSTGTGVVIRDPLCQICNGPGCEQVEEYCTNVESNSISYPCGIGESLPRNLYCFASPSENPYEWCCCSTQDCL